MGHPIRAALLVSVASLALGGCAAAIVPVAASGLLAHRGLRHRHPAAPAGTTTQTAAIAGAPAGPPARTTVEEPEALPPNVALAVPTADPHPAPAPLPADPAARVPNTVYAGALPAPGEARASSHPAAEPSRAADAPDVPDTSRGWAGLVRHVAQAMVDGTTTSVLLDRSTTAARPVWIPCGTKPRAVLVDLDAVRPARATRPDKAARDQLESIRTMDVQVVFFGVRTAADGVQGLAARTGLAAPQLDQDLFFFGAGAPAGLPALRAAVGARFCVLGVLGVRAEDFPNATAPGDPLASPGWFLAPAPRS